MFKTPAEKETWMQTEHLHYIDNGKIVDDEGCLYNPFGFEKFINGEWRTMMGIEIEPEDARKKLAEHRSAMPGVQIRCFRCNEIESSSIMPW